MSAAVIGALRVNLGLDSANFAAGLKQAASKMASFSSNLAKIAGAISGTAAPALASMGVSAMNAATEIQRASQLANAAPSEFQGWAAGAASVGIAQDKLADILKDTNDRVGDFIATGGGPMADFFERIAPKVGVTAEQFRKLSGPQALQLYVKSLEKANLNQQDMTFFMEAMASDSTALLPLLKNGGAAMAEYAAKAQALGAVMDDKTVASFARAKQTISEVGLALTGFKNIIAQQVVPPLAAMARAFVTAAQEGHWLGDLVRGFADLIPRLSTYVATFVGIIGAKWVVGFAAARVATLTLVGALTTLKGAIARTGIGLIAVAVGEMVYQIGRWVNSVGGLAAAFYTLKAKFLDVLRQMAGAWFEFTWAIAEGMNSAFGTSLTGVTNELGVYLFSAMRDAEDAAAAARSLGNEADGAAPPVNRLGGGLDQLKDKAGGAKEKLSALQNVLKSLKEELQMLQATLWMTDLDASIWEKQREAGVAAETVNGRLIDSQMRQIDGMKRLKAATDEWKDSISSAFSSFITQGGSFKKVLSDIIGKLAEMMMSRAFEKLWDTGGGKGFLGGTMKLLGFSNGTNFAPGGFARVHERGGEIMNLPRGTQIIPNDISKRMADNASKNGGGGNITIGFDGSMGGFTAVMRDVAGQEVSRASASITSQSVLAMQAAQKRGNR